MIHGLGGTAVAEGASHRHGAVVLGEVRPHIGGCLRVARAARGVARRVQSSGRIEQLRLALRRVRRRTAAEVGCLRWPTGHNHVLPTPRAPGRQCHGDHARGYGVHYGGAATTVRGRECVAARRPHQGQSYVPRRATGPDPPRDIDEQLR